MTDTALFPLNDEQKMILNTARDFAQKEIVPIAAEFDESGKFPMETVRKMGQMGLWVLKYRKNMAAQRWIRFLMC